ncbi:MAG: 5-histidylcysteine sulfoxide synthase [Campylobacterota bacterium]|nr:5-histidylcysteine sulfoxide synthase [Campylobacterota bacterium]
MKKIIRIPRLSGGSSQEKRQEIKHYFNSVYECYESLFTLLAEEKAYYVKADRLRHPLIFYYGHTATFFINKFKLAKIIDQRIDPKLESLFAVGVDEMSWDDLDETNYGWPQLNEARQYRDKVKVLVNKLIDTLPLTLPITEESPWWVILMGIEHENIHVETSSVLIRQLPLHLISPSDDWKYCNQWGDPPGNMLLNVPSGTVSPGKSKRSKLYGWDNEYGSHHAEVPSFKASKYLVSHAEFLPFVEEGGYNEDRFWEAEGAEWKRFSLASQPTFWTKENEGYRLRILTEEIPLPMNWPVEVNYHEAKAFCNWLAEKTGKSITLPTEDEYMRLRDLCAVPKLIEWEEKAPANINLEYYASSTPVDYFKQGEFYDVVGNVWQWSRTPIYPYEGFKVHPVYDDFTVPTYDGKHNLIKGGSWASCGNLATAQSRYAFRRHFFQHAGFRYVESGYEEQVETNSYESDRLISQYCHFGWGENYFGVENYPAACARLALEYMGDKPRRSALDLGCAIGRSSFELAKGFDHVIGIDFSARFIQHAEKLKQSGLLRYSLPSEGDLEVFYEIRLENFGLDDVCGKVEFWQGDACNLKPLYHGFDLIFAGNLLDRLYDPRKFLESLYDRINPGGLLILTSPYTWQEESTPRERWIGGFKKDGENFTTLDGLKEILEPGFSLKETRDVSFVIRETARKFQHTVAQMSVWERE